MTIIRFRHDKFTKKQMENTLVAKDFFQSNLPDDLKNRVDFNTPIYSFLQALITALGIFTCSWNNRQSKKSS